MASPEIIPGICAFVRTPLVFELLVSWCIHDRHRSNWTVTCQSMLLFYINLVLLTSMQSAEEDRLADERVGVVSPVFTSNDRWQPSPTLC